MKTKTEKTPDARWTSIAAMSLEDWSTVAARVSVCLDCRGPALLTDEQLEQVIAEPQCTRCRAQGVAA